MATKSTPQDLTEQNLTNFTACKNFKDNTERINSIDFSKNQLVTASDDDSISLYDLTDGGFIRNLHSKKYGVCHIHFDKRQGTSVLHASNKIDQNIRYLSLTENKYIRYFIGHQKQVTNIAMSPTDDSYVSGSLDNTLRIWDLRSSPCLGIMHVADPPVASYDPEGQILAVAYSSENLKFYDRRTFDKGPFRTFKFEELKTKNAEWTGIKFSSDGLKILIYTNGPVLYLFDAFRGTLLHTLTGHVNDKNMSLEASFTEDSKYVFCGSTDGKIHCWSVETGEQLGAFGYASPTPIQCLRFSQEYLMFATASDENLTLWPHL